MQYSVPLVEATFLGRKKRYVAEVAVSRKDHRCILCPNLGALRSCVTLGSRVWYLPNGRASHRLAGTWEIVEVDGGAFVNVNPETAKHILLEALENEALADFSGYELIERDYAVDAIMAHFDLALHGDDETCLLDVQVVTFADELGRAWYPDAHGSEQVERYNSMVAARLRGLRVCQVFIVQHTDANCLRISKHVAPQLQDAMEFAQDHGVEFFAFKAKIDANGAELGDAVRLFL